MIRRFLEWKRASWNRHRCHELAHHARYSAAAALEHLQQMEDDLLELRRLCPKSGNGLRTLVKFTEAEIVAALKPLDDLKYRGHVDPGLADLEREIERKR